MVWERPVWRGSTSCVARGHRLLLQGTREVPRSSPAAPGRARVVLAALVAVLAAPVLTATPAAAAPPAVTPGPAIEAFAPYQGQTTCDPVARPGALALRRLVLDAYPETADAGIVRPCTAGGASEHKEGRAWDWRVSTDDPDEVAQVAEFLDWLLASDEHGNPAAMARRLGVMYVIWDSKVWKSYQAARGWQPYVGASPHTDHVHISLSWAGAYGVTSYWTGTVAPVMQPPAVPVAPPAVRTVAPSADGVSDAAPGVVPTVTPVDRALQRRLAVSRVPGPWRRH
jgi:hypothetical protein